MGQFDSIAVKDYATLGIVIRARCRNCGRDRLLHGGLLARNFTPEDRINDYRLHQFAKRLKCGNCGAHWPGTELVVDKAWEG